MVWICIAALVLEAVGGMGTSPACCPQGKPQFPCLQADGHQDVRGWCREDWRRCHVRTSFSQVDPEECQWSKKAGAAHPQECRGEQEGRRAMEQVRGSDQADLAHGACAVPQGHQGLERRSCRAAKHACSSAPAASGPRAAGRKTYG